MDVTYLRKKIFDTADLYQNNKVCYFRKPIYAKLTCLNILY
jgi:hypothetical protein